MFRSFPIIFPREGCHKRLGAPSAHTQTGNPCTVVQFLCHIGQESPVFSWMQLADNAPAISQAVVP